MPRPTPVPTHRFRIGSALAFALGVLVIIAGIVVATTTSASAVAKDVGDRRYRAAALGALEAVLARREIAVSNLAKAGDPAEFAKWTDNYGKEYVGSCEVRWKVEPVRSAPRDAATPIAFIANPAPDIGTAPPVANVHDHTGAEYFNPNSLLKLAQDDSGNPYWQPNDSVYLFRIAGESRYLSYATNAAAATDDWSTPGSWRGRAQGVRYVAFYKTPLFRYVIFYAQDGPKGDLELNHGNSVSIQGNVHSNGSIYIGGGTGGRSWGEVRPDNGVTEIGPAEWDPARAYRIGDRCQKLGAFYQAVAASTNSAPSGTSSLWKVISPGRVRITGVNGIFCLSKPIAYGRMNDFSVSTKDANGITYSWIPTASPATAASSSSGSYEYDDRSSLTTPADKLHLDGTLDAGILSATNNGAFVNPYRINGASMLVTRPASSATVDNKRLINGVVLTGGWTSSGAYNAIAGNDSRDAERPDGKKWTDECKLSASAGGFDGLARTSQNGGGRVPLDETLSSRPLEAQALAYPTTYTGDRLKRFLERGDEHDFALPQFYTSSGITTDYAAARTFAAGILEWPGTYLSYCLGTTRKAPDLFFRRISRDTDAITVGATIQDGTKGFIGWAVTDKNGATVKPADSKTYGLIIRERPVPDFRYFGNNTDATTSATQPYLPGKTRTAPDYLPYAYGKHKSLAIWPFINFYVAANGSDCSTSSSSGAQALNAFSSNSFIYPASSQQRYTPDKANNGLIEVIAAIRRGADGVSTWTNVATDSATSLASANLDRQGYFRDHWRLIQLKRDPATVNTSNPAQIDLTAASNYFDIATFGSVQTRLQRDPDSTINRFVVNGTIDATTGRFVGSTSNKDPVAGLMIRPFRRTDGSVTTTVDTGAMAINSRDPYVALVFSPNRGIVLQRRFNRSWSQRVDLKAENHYYTGTKSSPTGTLPLDQIGGWGAPTSAKAVMQMTTWTPAVASTYNTPTTVAEYTNQVTSSIANSSSKPTTTFQINKTRPDGTTVSSPSYTLAIGPYKLIRTDTFWKESKSHQEATRATLGSTGQVVWTLTGQDMDFKTSMTTNYPGQTATLTWPTTWTSPSRSLWIIDPARASTSNWPSGPTLDPSPGTYPTGGRTQTISAANTAGATKGWFSSATTYTITINTNSTAATVIGASKTTKGTTVIAPSTYWPDSTGKGDATTCFTDRNSYGSALSWYTSNGFTESDLQADIKAKIGLTTFTTVGTDGTPATPTTPSPLADAVTPSPAAPSTGTAETYPDMRAKLWQVAVLHDSVGAAKSVRIETNSWISARGTWFSSDYGAHPGPVTPFRAFLPTSAYPEYVNYYLDNTASAYPVANTSSESFRPDYWTGTTRPTAADWTVSPAAGSEHVNDPDSGSIVWPTAYDDDGNATNLRQGYNTPIDQWLNSTGGTGASSGTANPAFWEDAQVPRWRSGTGTYHQEDPATSTPASLVWYNNDFWECKVTHSNPLSTDVPSATSTKWSLCTHLWLRIQRVTGVGTRGGFVFQYALGTDSPETTSWRWRTVCAGRTRGADGMPTDPIPASESLIPASTTVWPADTVVGLAVQARDFGNNDSTPARALFSNVKIVDSTTPTPNVLASSDKWEAQFSAPVAPAAVLGDRTVNFTTSYLCSQYQAFWGPLDITEDFFSYTTGTPAGQDANRCATEIWFYNPREFWSQSRWWNEADVLSNGAIAQRATWIEKETGTTTAPPDVANADPALFPWDATGLAYVSQREYMARTTALNLNMGVVQSYITSRDLKTAAYRWSDASYQGIASTARLSTVFNGLIYAARTNRYPRNPTVGHPDSSVGVSNNGDKLNPWNEDLTNTDSDATVHDLWQASLTTKQTYVRDRLVSDASTDQGERGRLSAPIRMQDFHHAVMLSNANDINWGYSSSPKFGESKTSIVTPNQLYLHGSFNDNPHTVDNKGTSETHYSPVAVMGDCVTLLSKDWSDLDYRAPGLLADKSKASGGGILYRITGRPVSNDTNYRTCILTNNQPTTKYRAFQGEGAPFVNTMLFLEDWGNSAKWGTATRNMEYTGSLVVLDSTRYTRATLGEMRTVGRSPFGIMGWHSDAKWKDLTGLITPPATTAEVGDLWCLSPTNASYTDADNNANAPVGPIPVYWPPNRRLAFNDDLLTEEGTPPFTPFGVTSSGVAGWTRTLR